MSSFHSSFAVAASGSNMTLLVSGGQGDYRSATADEVIGRARFVLAERFCRGTAISSPAAVKEYLQLHLAPLGCEVFAVLFLDAQHQVLDLRVMFRGTLTQTSVYPREVVKEALALNAGAAVLAHNHPSGSAEPSRADEMLTQALKQALGLVDVRVLDHIVVAGGATASFAERGLL
jgi:DNA repair protein RadC